MRRLLLSAIASLLVFAASAQTVFKGNVKVADKDTAIGYATVATVRDSLVLAATSSTSAGFFELAVKGEGKCKIEVSSVGYSPVVKEVSLGGGTVDLGDIFLSEGVDVDAVVLTVQKPIVTSDAEKLTYSVEDDPEAGSSTFEDIIRKVPQLSIDSEGKVKLNGQSDYVVLVNGRKSGSMSRNFDEVIKSMPASSIKRIEVITNPSMKYSAEGVGGVLNIITDRSSLDGYNGSVSAGFRNYFDNTWGTNESVNFSLQRGRFALTSAFYYSQSWAGDSFYGGEDGTINNLVEGAGYDHMTMSNRRKFDMRNLYGNVNASFQIDSLNLLTAEISAWGGKSRLPYGSTESYFGPDDNLLYTNEGWNSYGFSWSGVDITLGYQRSFGRDDHTLAVSNVTTIFPPSYDRSLSYVQPVAAGAVPDPLQMYSIYNNSRQRDVANEFQLDYSNRITSHHAVEAGMKYSYEFTRERSTSTYADAADVPTSETFGLARLSKHILAAYAGYSYTTEKFSGRAGARLESAWYRLNNFESGTAAPAGESQVYDNALVNAVPYVSLTYMPSAAHSLSFSYSERLSRPSIYSMSPFVEEGTMSRDYGNPNLRTGVSHSLQLKYSYTDNKVTFIAGARTMLSNNLIVNKIFIDDEGYFNKTYSNGGRMRSYMGDVSVSYRPATRFNMSFSFSGGWSDYRLPSLAMRNDGWSFTQSLNLSIGLWKGSRLTLSEYLLKMEPNQMVENASLVLMTGASLSQKLLKDKLELNLMVNNPHEKYSSISVEHSNATTSLCQKSMWLSRSIRFSVTWRFGGSGVMVKRVNRNTNDMSESVGKGGSGGAGVGGGMGGM